MKKRRDEPTIQINNLKITIGEKEIVITDRFTLILGKFKKELLAQFQHKSYSIPKNYNLIPFDEFIEIFQNQTKNFTELSKTVKLLEYIREFHNNFGNNIEIFSQYNRLIESINFTFDFNLLLKKKKALLEELKLSEASERSSELTAISDLIEKLNGSLKNKRNKLDYLEEDFLHLKNQMDQIKKTLNEFNLEIKNLNKQKKECFNQINRITRQMEGLKKEEEDNLILTMEIDENLTNAEKIQALQKKAKKLQYNINDFRTKSDDTKIKFEELSPQYEILEKDYRNLLAIIENDQNRLNNLKDEYKEKIKEFEYSSDEDLDIKNFQTIRLSSEIKEEIENVNIELSNILNSNNQIKPKNSEDLSFIIKKLLEFQEFLKKETLTVKYDQKDMFEIFEKFRRLEALVNELQELLNKFLAKINIESQLQIAISDENEFFFIQLNFVRNNEKHLTFDGLTTPEKIFFIMIFHISIKILLKNNNIIFSNVFLPNQYNKLSIFRTIRKILPLFESEKKLLRINLIFIISNLEMKKKIENLRVINFKES